MSKAKTASILLFAVSLALFLFCIFVREGGQDQSGPEIQMDQQEIQVSIAADDATLLQGVTATDRKDGDVTDSLVVESISNFIEKGRRKVSIVAFDSDNHITRAERDIVYTDYTSPTFTLDAPLRFSMDSESLTEGLHAQDCLDGDITSQIRASYNDAVYVQQAGDYPITVQVSNSAGDTCTVNLTVTVTDPSDENESQKYYPLLSQYIVYAKVGGSVDYDSLITGFEHNGAEYLFEEEDDDFMPGKRGDVDISGDVNFDKAGSYTVDYRFTPEDGVTATTKLVVVVG